MAAFSTTKLSSKGQIVIPEEIRDDLGLKTGMQFMIIGQGDTVILRTITPPTKDELKSLLEEARVFARKANLKKSDVKKAIKKVRSI